MISAAQYSSFIWDYYHGKYPHERLGQAFCNAFKIPDDAELFYEENRENAYTGMYKHIDWEKPDVQS